MIDPAWSGGIGRPILPSSLPTDGPRSGFGAGYSSGGPPSGHGFCSDRDPVDGLSASSRSTPRSRFLRRRLHHAIPIPSQVLGLAQDWIAAQEQERLDYYTAQKEAVPVTLEVSRILALRSKASRQGQKELLPREPRWHHCRIGSRPCWGLCQL